MKKIIFLLTIGLVLMLSACGGSASSSEIDTTSGSTQTTTGQENALPESTQLIIGTMLLDETDSPVDAQQAETLVKLWKAYQSVLNSETSAEAEISAVLKQIKAEMSAEQTAAIEAMGLTNDNLQEKMQALGVEMGGMMDGEQDPSFAATMQAMRESGEMPNMEGGQMPQGGNQQGGNMPQGGGPQGGNMPQGGDMAGGVMPDASGTMMGAEGEEMGSAQLATLQAQRGSRGGQGADRFLLSALIDFLDAKISS